MSSSSTADVQLPRSRRSSTHRSVSSAYRQPIWRSPSFIRTTTGVAPAASVSIVFAEPEQGAPLARASARIPISGSPLSMREVRREEEENLSVGGHEGNETTSYDAPSSSAQRHSKPSSNSWFLSLTRSKGKSAMRTAVPSQLIPDPPPHPEIESPTPEMTTPAAPQHCRGPRGNSGADGGQSQTHLILKSCHPHPAASPHWHGSSQSRRLNLEDATTHYHDPSASHG